MGRALRQHPNFVELEDDMAEVLREMAAIEDMLSGLGSIDMSLCDERLVFRYLADRMARWRSTWKDNIERLEAMSPSADNEN